MARPWARPSQLCRPRDSLYLRCENMRATYLLTTLRPLGASLYTIAALFFDSETASVEHTPNLCIACQQECHAQNLVTAQLVEISDGTQLEDVLNHVFQQGFVDPNWSLKRRRATQDPLVHGPGSTPESALSGVICMLIFDFFDFSVH